MRNKLLKIATAVVLFVLLSVEGFSQANAITAKTVNVSASIFLRTKRADSLSADATFTSNSDNIIPTQKAVKTFTTNTFFAKNATITTVTGTTTVAAINIPAGTAKTSPIQGDLFASIGHLFYRDNGTTYDILSPLNNPDTLHVQNVGSAGVGLGYVLPGNIFKFSKLVQGANITLTVGADSSVTVASTGGGGGGNTNSNIGTGFRLAVPLTNNIKTLFAVGGTWDSTSNTNALTFNANVVSVTNGDGSLIFNNSSGAVTGSLALGHTNTWTILQNFGALTASGLFKLTGTGTTPATKAMYALLTDSTNSNVVRSPMQLVDVTSIVNGDVAVWSATANNFVVGSPLSYRHTVFTPSTGNTVTLVNNQANIIKPSAGIAALTLALPGSPSNNDVITLIFTQSVTTITYSGGTVVGTPTAAAAGSTWYLIFDSATSTWY